MSFERFSTSDIYMYEHVGGFIECCACSITTPWSDEPFGFARFATPHEALEHLDQHEQYGDDIGGARNRIIKEYPDLDIEIQPWKPTPEYEARHKELMDNIKAKYGNQHPPQQFRDRSNGE